MNFHVCQKTHASFRHMGASFRGQLEIEFSENQGLVGSFFWALGLRSWLLGSATSYYRKPLASLPPPYQLVQGILTQPNIRMTHQQAASESWLGPDAERQSEYST